MMASAHHGDATARVEAADATSTSTSTLTVNTDKDDVRIEAASTSGTPSDAKSAVPTTPSPEQPPAQIAEPDPLTLKQTLALYSKLLLHDPRSYPLFLYLVTTLFLNMDTNLLSPNLTAVARDFNMTANERDFYLGGILSMTFYLIGGFAALVAGLLGDAYSRRNLLCLFVVVGQSASICTLAVKDFSSLLATRSVVAVAIGGTQPLVMSMISDQFPDKHRGRLLGLLGLLSPGGTLFGQIIASVVGPTLGWRVPFLVTAFPSLCMVPLLLFTTKEPARGHADARAATGGAAPDEEWQYDRVSKEALKDLVLHNRTAMLFCLAQFPASLPAGVITIYGQDFLVQDVGPNVGGITVQSSVAAVMAYAIAGAFGVITGAVLVDWFWKRKVVLVPVILAVSVVIATPPFYAFVNAPLPSFAAYCALLIPVSFFSTICNGGGSTAMLMNVCTPDTRSTASAANVIFTDLGYAFGPFFIAAFIVTTGTRMAAFNYILIFWFVEAGLLLLCVFYVRKDAQEVLRRVAETLRRNKEGKRRLRGGEEKEEGDKEAKTKADGNVVDDSNSSNPHAVSVV